LVLRQWWNGSDFAQIDLDGIVIECRRIHVVSVSRCGWSKPHKRKEAAFQATVLISQ
jgi:hypothetical protein